MDVRKQLFVYYTAEYELLHPELIKINENSRTLSTVGPSKIGVVQLTQ